MNRRVLEFGLVAFGLMLATTLSVWESPVYAADETPDLVVETSKVSSQVVELKVTNKSKWWANETMMTVQAVGQQTIAGTTQPHQQGQAFPIENLDPGQSTSVTFTLQVPCMQHTVTANVVPAANYEDVKETNTRNNTITVPLCSSPPAAQPAADPDALIEFGGCACQGNEPKPPVNREKAVSVRADGATDVSQGEGGGLFADDYTVVYIAASPEFAANVGWNQIAGTDVASYGVHFSNGFLDWSNSKINSAVLTYEESELFWTSGGGGHENKPGCVTRIFTTPTIEVTGQFQSTFLQAVYPASKRIDLTAYLQSQTAGRGSAPNLNFVLRGAMDSVDGDDKASCQSSVRNPVLDIKFEPR
jgi:hypothetical protein